MTKKFCSECGAKLAEKSKFCSSCGKQLIADYKDPRKAEHEAIQHLSQPESPGERKLRYIKRHRKSDVITTDDENGEPIVKFRNLHPNAIWLFFFQYLGKTAILMLLFGLGLFLEPYISLSFMAVYLVGLFIAAAINYRNYEFEVTPLALHITYGVVHKYSVSVSFEQIQNINKRRTLIDRLLGLAHLEIDTAGTGGEVVKNVGGLMSASEGYIPGVTPDEADDILQLVLARIQASD